MGLQRSDGKRSDGKRPDGITVLPWKLLVWDATCPDTFAPSYSGNATRGAGLVAAAEEERKEAKYTGLSSLHCFTPDAIETSGVLGPKSLLFVSELERCLARVTGELRSTNYLHVLQRLSVAVQRGNSAAVMGTMDLSTTTDFLVKSYNYDVRINNTSVHIFSPLLCLIQKNKIK